MSKVICERNDIVAIANAVRNKTGSTDQMSLGGIVTGINSITGSNNGTDTSDATATAGDILSGKTAYVDGKKLTGTIPTRSIDDMTFKTDSSFGYVSISGGYYDSGIVRTFPAGSARTPTHTFTTTPTISVDSTGKITASVNSANSITPTVSAGYVGKGTAGTITVSGSTIKQLTTQASKTITPSESSQTAVTSGVYTTGAITVAAIPSNYEDVTEETNAYTDKIASLESAVTALETELQGKASGGGAGGDVPTCTITVNSFAANIAHCIYTTYENGKYEYHDVVFNPDKSSVVLTNVVYGSTVHVYPDYEYCAFAHDKSKYIYTSDYWDRFECVPIGDDTITVIDDD